MRPRERRETGAQELFRSRLDQIIDMDRALAKLARTIDWAYLEATFGAVYADGARPAAFAGDIRGQRTGLRADAGGESGAALGDGGP